MLKNVAIPLMLAASQAEAQDAKMSKEMQERVKESLRADLAREFNGLQADAAACTVASSQDADNIANLAQTQADKQAALEGAEKAVADLIADDGPWGLANTKRKDAVAAAVAQEAAENIAGLLDDLDTAAEAERVAAAAFVAADKLYQAGVTLAATELARHNAAQTKLGELNTAQLNAAASVTAANEQITKETNWRKWRYCELGAKVTDAADVVDAQGWWQFLSDTYSAARPNSCEVPAVMSGDATPVETRPAVLYYTAKAANQAEEDANAGLVAESGDGTKRWQAQVILNAAETAEASTELVEGFNRTKAGVVAWRVGALARARWIEMKRLREKAWYTHINAAVAKALVVATGMADTDTYAAAATASDDQKALGIADAEEGAATILKAKKTLRDGTTLPAGGSGYQMAAARTQSTTAGEEWKTAWAITAGSMDAWTGKADGSSQDESGLHKWWTAAKTLTTAVDAWWTKWGTDNLQLTAGNGAFARTKIGTDGCVVDSHASGTWQASASGEANIAACKTACEAMAVSALLINVDTTAGSGGATTNATNGGATMATYAGGVSTTWCGGYSYISAGASNQKCQLLQNASVPVQAAVQAGQALDECATMTTVAAFASAQADVANGWAGVTSALVTGVKDAADAQAVLEQAWLRAWYHQQYWAAIKTELTNGTAGSAATASATAQANLELSTENETTTAGALKLKSQADTALTTAQAELAAVQATTAAAQATVTALGARILRADAQLAELRGLVKESPAKGTLDEAAAARLADWEAFKSTTADDEGEATLAEAAKNSSAAAIAARTNDIVTDEAAHTATTSPATGAGGPLLEARLNALGAWNLAISGTGAKKGDLSAALDSADLAALRKTVEDDTAAWDDQQTTLEGLVRDVVDAEGELKAATEAREQAVLDCQIKSYDNYRTTLEAAMMQRIEDLKTIQALIEAAVENAPKPGTEGARCEKALSNGTRRPARGESTCAEGLCCGAARVWMAAGDGVEDAAWRTIETCQSNVDGAGSFSYQPPRAPMATSMPNTISVPFTCIEGAKKLAAAASAVAAAVYMLA